MASPHVGRAQLQQDTEDESNRCPPISTTSVENSMQQCPDCARQVPTGNMLAHRLHCSGSPVHTIDRTPSPENNYNERIDNGISLHEEYNDEDAMDVDDDGSNNLDPNHDFREVAEGADRSECGSVDLLASDSEDDINVEASSPSGRNPAVSGAASAPISIPDTPPENGHGHANILGRAGLPLSVDSPEPMVVSSRSNRRGRPKRDRSTEAPSNNQRGRPKRDDAYDSPNVSQGRANSNVVDLVDADNARIPNNGSDDEVVVEEWQCPRCTLLNPVDVPKCGACENTNPNAPRNADPVRTERLIGRSFDISDYVIGPPDDPMMYMGGGALLGGLFGGANSFLQGRGVVSGLAEGALSGAVGGAAVGSALRTPPAAVRRRQENRQLEAARTSAMTGLVSYPSLSRTESQNRSAPNEDMMRPRRSIRVHGTRIHPSFSQPPIFQGADSPVLVARRGLNSDLHSLMSLHGMPMSRAGRENARRRLFARQIAAQMAGPAADLDGMSYDQLLQRFGDGTENLGASISEISQLPTAIVTDPERELPEGSRECSVCLEAFESGEERKTLPCLHGFHSTCIDKWLQTNSSCPICKHRINGD